MAASQYIRPVGRLRPPSTLAASLPSAFEVAGRKDLLFAAAEFIERAGGNIERRIVAADDLLPDDAAGSGTQVLHRLRQARPAIAGLTLEQTRIMGVVNVTPDSFSDGGRYLATDAAIAHGLQLEAEGADILDIGGEFTRPGAEPLGIEDECRRVLPVIEGLARRARVPLSIDTRNAEVMRSAAQSRRAHHQRRLRPCTRPAKSRGCRRKRLAGRAYACAGRTHAPCSDNPVYDDVVLDVYDALESPHRGLRKGRYSARAPGRRSGHRLRQDARP